LDVAPPDVNPLDAPPADAPDDARRPCARDGDCAGLSLCGPAGFCVPLACTPGRAACLDATRLEACDARGAASTVTECPAGCVDGACSRCPSPTTACAGRCVTTATDPSHCGACGRACASDQACEGGACVVPCASPRTRCGSVCVDLQSDAANCGGCGRACSAGQTCAAGACVTGCASPRVICGTSCVDLQASAANCGACGRACVSGQYPYNSGDTNACRAWKLAATVCTTQPTSYTDTNNWQCPMAGGFTDPAFGTFCAVTNQYACSTCPGACNASCIYIPLSLRNCMGVEATQN
jgi:hypothetical protein